MTMKLERLVLPSGRLVFIETVRGPRYDLVSYRPSLMRVKRPKARAPKTRGPAAAET